MYGIADDFYIEKLYIDNNNFITSRPAKDSLYLMKDEEGYWCLKNCVLVPELSHDYAFRVVAKAYSIDFGSNLNGVNISPLATFKTTLNLETSNVNISNTFVCPDCGNIVTVPNSYLTTGDTGSCGCYQKDSLSKDLSNKKFGKLTASYKTDKQNKNGHILWHCKCECGNEKDVSAETLRRGESRSCGCLAKEKSAENGRSCRIDLTNQKFGKLTAIKPTEKRLNGQVVWLCQCECGNEVSVVGRDLRSGKT